jgi:hypothetical protein
MPRTLAQRRAQRWRQQAGSGGVLGRDPTPEQWADYLDGVRHQFKLLDGLPQADKVPVWEDGFDAVYVRRCLARHRRMQPRRRGIQRLSPAVE